MCLPMMMALQEVGWAQPAKGGKTERSHLRRLIGAWSWRRRASRPQRKRRWKNFAALIGDLFTVSYGDKALDPRKRKILPKAFLRCFWSVGIWMLCAKTKGVCVLICSRR